MSLVNSLSIQPYVNVAVADIVVIPTDSTVGLLESTLGVKLGSHQEGNARWAPTIIRKLLDLLTKEYMVVHSYHLPVVEASHQVLGCHDEQ